jgi:hypothetical protein
MVKYGDGGIVVEAWKTKLSRIRRARRSFSAEAIERA